MPERPLCEKYTCIALRLLSQPSGSRTAPGHARDAPLAPLPPPRRSSRPEEPLPSPPGTVLVGASQGGAKNIGARVCAHAGANAPRRKLAKSVEFLDFG